jgi:hypothetical protein
MSKFDLSVDQIENEIAAAYKEYLVVSGRLTLRQAQVAEYSYVILELQEGDERPSLEE